MSLSSKDIIIIMVQFALKLLVPAIIRNTKTLQLYQQKVCQWSRDEEVADCPSHRRGDKVWKDATIFRTHSQYVENCCS